MLINKLVQMFWSPTLEMDTTWVIF